MTLPIALIIEDDAKLAEIFSSAIVAGGYETVMASDGRSAVLSLQSLIPALIILDLHLPDIPGSELLRTIKQDVRLQNSILMLATADVWMAESLRAEVDFVLMKPISFTQLRDLTERLRPQTPPPT